MGIGEAGAVNHVLEPGAAGDAVGIQPVPLHFHLAVIHRFGQDRIDGARG